MFGVAGGYHVANQPGLYDGLKVILGTDAYKVKVEKGLANVGEKFIEHKTAAIADIAIPSALGIHKIYLNADGAKDADGNALSRFGFTPEADKKTTAIQGSVDTKLGRSIVLAAVEVSPHSGTVTLTGSFADTETITVTVDGTAVVTTLNAQTAASVTTAAAAVAAALNANATVAGKVIATSALGVVTIKSKTATSATNYSLTAADTAASGTATASGANLAGGGTTDAKIDNLERFKHSVPPRTMAIR